MGSIFSQIKEPALSWYTYRGVQKWIVLGRSWNNEYGHIRGDGRNLWHPISDEKITNIFPPGAGRREM